MADEKKDNTAAVAIDQIDERAQVILLEPLSQSLTKLRQNLSKEKLINVMSAASLPEAIQVALQSRPCILAAAILGPQDAAKLLTLVTAMKKDVKAGRIKVFLTSAVKGSAIISRFEAAGCQEFMTEPVSERQLQFKMSLQIKANIAARKQHKTLEMRKIKAEAEKILDQSNTTFKNEAQTQQNIAEGQASKKEAAVKELGPQEIAEDVWAFKNNKANKKGKKWTFRMHGPDPSEGQFQEMPEKTPEGESQWRWMPKDEKDKKKGSWIYSGDEPQATAQGWNFQGEKPELKFVTPEGEVKAKKVSTDEEGNLLTAKDSQAALAKIEAQEKEAERKKEEKRHQLQSKIEQSKLEQEAKAKEQKAVQEQKAAAHAQTQAQNLAQNQAQVEQKKSEKASEQENRDKNKSSDKLNKLGLKDEHKPSLATKLGTDKPVVKNEIKNLELKEEKKSNTALNSEAKKESILEKNEKLKSFETQKNTLNETSKQENKDHSNLAKLAMNFDDDKETNETSTAEKNQIEGKNNAKTEHINSSSWNKKDLTPDELKTLEERKKRLEALKAKQNLDNVTKEKKSESNVVSEQEDEFGDIEDVDDINSSESEELEKKSEQIKNPKDLKKSNVPATKEPVVTAEDDGLNFDESLSDKTETDAADNLSSRNFLKKKEKKPQQEKNEESESHSQIVDSSEKDSHSWQGRDSSSDVLENEEGDSLQEEYAKGGSLKVGDVDGGTFFEYPLDHFGASDGAWEKAGEDSFNEQTLAVHVFILPDVKMKKIPDLTIHRGYWLMYGERPIYSLKKKAWYCKDREPRFVELFSDLPHEVQEYLLRYSPGTPKSKRDEILSQVSKKEKNSSFEELDAHEEVAHDEDVETSEEKTVEAKTETEAIHQDEEPPHQAEEPTSSAAAWEARRKLSREEEEEFLAEADEEIPDTEDLWEDDTSSIAKKLLKRKQEASQAQQLQDDDEDMFSEEKPQALEEEDLFDEDENLESVAKNFFKKKKESFDQNESTQKKEVHAADKISKKLEKKLSRHLKENEEDLWGDDPAEQEITPSSKEDESDISSKTNDSTQSKGKRYSPTSVMLILMEANLKVDFPLKEGMPLLCKIVSQSLSGAETTVFRVPENFSNQTLSIAASTNLDYRVGDQIDVSNKNILMSAIQSREVKVNFDNQIVKELYCPIVDEQKNILGLIQIVKNRSATDLGRHSDFIKAVAMASCGFFLATQPQLDESPFHLR